MSKLVQDLLGIQESIRQSEQDKARLQGVLQGQYATLKKDHGCDSLLKAEEKYSQLELDREKLKKKIIKVKNQLKEYGWDI